MSNDVSTHAGTPTGDVLLAVRDLSVSYGKVEAVSRLNLQVMAGQMIFPAAARRWLTPTPSPTLASTLSERENEVLALVAEGFTNSQIAQRLHVSDNTIKFHLQNIYQRLGVSNRTEASRRYLSERL